MDTKISMVIEGDIAKIELGGKLDANNAPRLMDELKSLVGKEISKIVFLVSELEYISSAGLRAIVFSKQKIGAEVEVVLVGAKKAVTDVISMSGLDNFMTFQDSI